MTHVGFTGTRQGMTLPQQEAVFQLLTRFGTAAVHHGDCVGADAQFHEIVRKYSRQIQIFIHPSTIQTQRAGCLGDAYYNALPPLDRDTMIVQCSSVLIAAPKDRTEQIRSGTWATVRRARSAGKPVFFAWADGTFGQGCQ